MLAIAALLGVIFGVYNSFHTPQEDIEKQQLLLNKDVGDRATLLGQKETENKATLLAQQVEMTAKNNETKFVELSTRLETAMTLAENHIHTVDSKVESLIHTVADMNNHLGNELVRISTILEERLPKKMV